MGGVAGKRRRYLKVTGIQSGSLEIPPPPTFWYGGRGEARPLIMPIVK